jgi:hypothetical protein
VARAPSTPSVQCTACVGLRFIVLVGGFGVLFLVCFFVKNFHRFTPERKRRRRKEASPHS